MYVRTPIILAGMAAACLAASAPARAQVTVTEAPAPVAIRRPDLGLSLRTPRGFAAVNPAQVPDGITLLYTRPGGTASVALVVRPAPTDVPAARRADLLARSLAKSEPGFRLENSGTARMAGEDAAVVTGFLIPSPPAAAPAPAPAASGDTPPAAPPPPLKTCSVAVVHGERLYLFTLTAEERLWKQAAGDFLTSVESVKWLD